MIEYELIKKSKKGNVPCKYKKRSTKIDMNNLEYKVVNMIAQNKDYTQIAKSLVKYMRTRKRDPKPNFSLSKQTVKKWWMENSRQHNDLVNEQRNALVTHRHHQVLDKGVKIRNDVITGLKSDVKRSMKLEKTSFDVEATERGRVKIVQVQESAEKAVANQSPNLTVNQVIINPLTDFTDKIKKALKKKEEEEANTIDVEYEDVDEDTDSEEDEVEEE